MISPLVFDFTHSSLFISSLYVLRYVKNMVRTSHNFFYFLMNPSVEYLKTKMIDLKLIKFKSTKGDYCSKWDRIVLYRTVHFVFLYLSGVTTV